jgi:tetratricopeptide (TPR) repeat protein
MIDKFQVGMNADFLLEFFENDYNTTSHTDNAYNYDDVRTVVGAGPTLVKDGVIVLDAALEGFSEDKILILSAQRSLVGVTASGIMGMVSVPNVTLAELAEIALNLGMVEAINLDGGASSGVYYDDAYVSMTGRDISNALVVRRLYEDPINIEVNNKKVFFDTEPYINKEFSRTLVPLRGIAEALGATVGWDGTTSSVTIERYGTILKLQVDSNIVYLDSVRIEMEIPVIVKESRTYVPARFITEFFGGEVDWNELTHTVILDISSTAGLLSEAATLEANEAYEQAIEKYKEVLTIDETNLQAAKQIATIYNTNLNNKVDAITYYELALSIDSTDYTTMNSLAWAYYALGQINTATEIFTNHTEKLPNSPSGYYGLGVCYSYFYYDKYDITKAKEYFQMSLDRDLTGASQTYALNYLATN